MYVPPASGQKVHAACTMSVQLSVRVSLSLSLSLAPHPKRFRSTPPKKIRRLSRTARKREVARTSLANQEASGAGKAFAYGTGAGGRSHLAKLRDGARHCNSALSLSRFCCEFSLGRLRRLGAPPQREFAAKTRDSVHRYLRGATRWCATL